ncbi:MAG TPA: tRNA (adenosine(37)-N6)-threonylcarbamoyltransferase complex dimerization subunit type 1 TsaB [Sphingomicrobium sp.]|jgi:tRNA threonylcarbamoyl adenosine modification protein YeaZ|nr:tRNA (adenosine(37)-N6)-threonylcarbamoyltransferase complex dimerization subunit type 1 TsaB [Sphingomicrobium sp.]
MLLAFDTSSAACTAALFDGSGECIARADEVIGRGHAERLVPMIAELMDGRAASHILVGVGPGSFTGIRVSIAAAHGLAIGWGAELAGMSSLALLAAGATADGEVAAAVLGGHGELFVQRFEAATLQPTSALRNAAPAEAAVDIAAPLVVGSGAKALIDARGWGEAVELWPSAANALRLPVALRSLQPKPVYARAPDAKVREAA